MCTALEWSCLSFWQDASPWTGTQMTLKFIEAEFQFVWFLLSKTCYPDILLDCMEIVYAWKMELRL
jgi:hypothetical protein